MDDYDAGGRWRIGRLVLELFVVFIGVTSAFLVDQYREQRARDERRDQMAAALVQELASLADALESESPDFERAAADFEAREEAGERPPLRMAYLNGAFRADMWDAALAVGGVELLDPSLAVRLSFFYTQVGELGGEVERWNRLSEELLLPYVSAGSDRFYDESGRLRPEYEWYTRGIRRISQIMTKLADDGRALADELQEVSGH